MKSRIRGIGGLIFSVVIASVLLFSLHQLSSTEANDPPPSFNPTSSIALSNTAAFGNPDHITTFNVPIGDVNFGGSGAALVTFLPAQWCIATHSNDCSTTETDPESPNFGDPTGPAVPVGTVTGDVVTVAKLALQGIALNSTCNVNFPVTFPKFVEAVPDDSAGTIAPGPVAAGNTLNPLALDGATVNGIPAYAELWPTFLSELLDPDGNPGTTNTVFPIARYAGDTLVSTTDVVLQTLVFAPGALHPDNGGFLGQPWDTFVATLGYPVLTVLQDPTKANKTDIADFCSPLDSITTVNGTTTANSTPCRLCGATAASVAGGSVLHENDSATSGIGDSGTHLYRFIGQGGRDYDGDSYETAFDSCATLHNLDGDPRNNNGTDNDGLDSACDPRPNAVTQFDPTASEDGAGANSCGDGADNGADGADIFDIDECHTTVTLGTGGTDTDGDGWANRLDNCPLVANALQTDVDVGLGVAVPGGGSPFDDIGDDCEPNYDGDGNGCGTGAEPDPEECGLSPTVSDGGYLDAIVKSFACNGSSDADGDGWCLDRETFAGTDPNDDCADNTSDDAVPVDNNNDRAVNIQDRANVVAVIIAATNLARFDLNGDGNVNIKDRAATVISNGWECTN